MLTVLLVPNTEKEGAAYYAEMVCAYLKDKAEILYYKDGFCDFDKVDIIIVFGGDGTLLETASYSSKHKIPVLGINLGSLGFLAEVEKHEITESLDKLLLGDYTIEERMMLHARLVSKDGKKQEFDCLNDFVISRANQGGLVDLKLYIGDEPVEDFKADGIIFATPTGSSAYSLSAGGPFLDPSVSAFLITPVCPHSIYSRAIVYSSDKEISITPNQKNNSETVVIGDGRVLAELKSSDKLIITKSHLTTKLIRLKNHAFYNTLKNKLMH